MSEQFSIIVEETKARLLATVEQYDIQTTTYPRRLVQLVFGDEDLTAYAVSLSFEDSTAVIVCEIPHAYLRTNSHPADTALEHLWGKPMQGMTEAGERFEVQAAHPVSSTFGFGHENEHDRVVITANYWSLTSATPCLWVGRLEGGLPQSTGNVNLHVGEGFTGSFSRTTFGLLGAQWTYFLFKKKKTQLSDKLVIDTVGENLSYEILNREMQALGFCLGRPLRCKFLVGLDEHGQTVAYAGGEYGYDRLQPNHQFSPVPEDHFRPWFTLLFERLTRLLSNTPPDSPRGHSLYEAMHLYVESASELYGSSREVKALLACLEMARWFVGRESVLVKSIAKWERWAVTSKLLGNQAESGLETLLRTRVKEAAHPGPVELVYLALQAAQLPLNSELLEAIRGSSLLLTSDTIEHTYDETQMRCLRLRTLCAGVFAKAVGYQGPLAGWQMPGRPNRYAESPDAAWFAVDDRTRITFFEVRTTTRLSNAQTSELWPVFARPAVPDKSLVSVVEKFAQNLAPRTDEQVRARVIPLPVFSDDEPRLYDFTLQSLPVPMASTVLFTIRQNSISDSLNIINWDEEVEPIIDEKSLTRFLSEVARATRTRHAIERLLLLTPEVR